MPSSKIINATAQPKITQKEIDFYANQFLTVFRPRLSKLNRCYHKGEKVVAIKTHNQLHNVLRYNGPFTIKVYDEGFEVNFFNKTTLSGYFIRK